MAQITNSASASYSYGTSGSSNSTSNTVTAELLEEYAISATKYAINQTFRPGGTVTYAVQVTNSGTSPLYAITVSDDLEATNELTYLDGSAYIWTGETFSLITPSSTNPLTFILDNSLASGDSIFIVFSAVVSTELTEGTTTIENNAIVTGREGSSTGTEIRVDPDPSATITLEDYANLEIVKTISTTQITSGDEFSFTLDITNTGNISATGIVLTDVLPDGFSVSSITETNGGTTTALESSDYSVDTSTNTLSISSVQGETISLDADAEITVVITGTIS